MTTTEDVAKSAAAKFFKDHGNPSEIRVSQAELAAMFEVVADVTVRRKATPTKVPTPKEVLKA